jgi:NarL family two-component system response regulator LiaR
MNARTTAGHKAPSNHAAPQLTAREAEVLSSLMRGDENKEIARNLSCSVKTVEFHLSNLFRKFGVRKRTALVALAVERRVRQEAREP